MNDQEVDREKITKNWLARGFTCELWVDPPGQKWEDFVHEVDEVVIVISGELEIEVEGNLFHPGIGEEILIRRGMIHSTRNTGTKAAHWLYGYRILDS